MKKILLSIVLISSLSLFADEDNTVKIKNISPYQQFEDWFELFFKYSKNNGVLFALNPIGDKIIINNDRISNITNIMSDSVHMTLVSVYNNNPCIGFVHQDTVTKEESIVFVLKTMDNIYGIADTNVHFVPDYMGELKQETYYNNKNITQFYKQFKDGDIKTTVWLYYDNKLGKVVRIALEF